uniref:Mytilin N n=1 Tax=Mytilus galloprovincialis TaxID=29158 RepID=A0A0C5Q4H5_MYTGA|nr:Mytilin N [Mytilus galloprovincialis]
MKAAIILAIALVVILAVNEADAICSGSFSRRCKSICRARRCRYYAAFCFAHRVYCRCLRCTNEHTMKFPENKGSSPSDMFPWMNDKNTYLFKNIQNGEIAQGETDL